MAVHQGFEAQMTSVGELVQVKRAARVHRGRDGDGRGEGGGGSGEGGGVGGSVQAGEFARAGGGQQRDDEHDCGGEEGDGCGKLPIADGVLSWPKVAEMLFDRVRRRQMHTGEHGFSGGRTVQVGRNGDGANPALAELRSRLNDGLARSRTDRKDLTGQSGRGRTTVWEAF